MNVPLNAEDFNTFINENKIFERTNQLMSIYLKTWYEDDEGEFIQSMWADINTVMNTYHFENEGVSISKSYASDPPLDYISCWIRIYDAENGYCGEYTAFYDYNLNCFDDKIRN